MVLRKWPARGVDEMWITLAVRGIACFGGNWCPVQMWKRVLLTSHSPRRYQAISRRCSCGLGGQRTNYLKLGFPLMWMVLWKTRELIVLPAL